LIGTENVKDYIPIIVVLISTLLAYFIGKNNEKNKRLAVLAEESLDEHISLMYREVIEIYTIGKSNIKKIKKFIIKYSSKNDLHKLYDNELNINFLEMSIKIRTNKISNNDLKKEFEHLAMGIETLYWDRLKVTSSELKWWIKKKINNKWYSVPLDLLFSLKDFFEYLSVLSVILTVFGIADLIANDDVMLYPKGSHGILFGFTFLILLIYIGLKTLDSVFSSSKAFTKKRFIK